MASIIPRCLRQCSSRTFSTTNKSDSEFIKKVREKALEDRKIAEISKNAAQQAKLDQQPQWFKNKDSYTKWQPALKFIPRQKSEAPPQIIDGDDQKIGDGDLPAEVTVRFTLETFFKHYIAIEKKYNKSESSQDKFELSMQVMRKIFNIKIYQMQNFELDGPFQQQAIDRLSAIVKKHINFMLSEYALKDEREYLIKASLQSESTNFELFLIMFESPFKIRLNFYSTHKVAIAFLEGCFKYIAELAKMQSEGPNEWVMNNLNKNFIIALCDQLTYCYFKHPGVLEHIPHKLTDETVNEQTLNDKGEILIEEIDSEVQPILNQRQIRFDYKVISDVSRFILEEQCKEFLEIDKDIKQRREKLKVMAEDSPQFVQSRLKLDNEVKLLQMKVVALIKYLDKVIYTLNTISKNGVHPYYDLFDTCAYFLIRFSDYIEVGSFTDLTFMLIKKNAKKRNEDLLYIYRQKIQDNMGHLTIGHMQKVLFILSRSPFPFSEIILHQFLFSAPQQPKSFSKLRNFEIGSIIPSLAKARYNNNQVIDALGLELLRQFRDDYTLMDPHFLKVLLERIMSLDYKDSSEAQLFFSGIKELTKIKSVAIATLVAKAETERQKLAADKQVKSLEVIDQYCDYILNKDKEGFKVDLMVDS